MSYIINCQNCNEEMEFKSLRIGDSGRCKNCRERIQITSDAKFIGEENKKKLSNENWFVIPLAIIMVIILVILHGLFHY